MKEIKGFEYYYITKDGRVINKKGILRKTQISILGYERVLLKNKKIKKNVSVHRLVAIAFIPNTDNKPCVNHKDGNRSNNHVDNLEWCTQSENVKHGFDSNNRIHGNNKKVKNIKTGVIYKNIRDAAKENGYKYPTLVAMLGGINPNKSNLIKL